MAFSNDYLNVIADLIDTDTSYLALVADYTAPTSSTDIGDAGVKELGRVVPTVSVSGSKVTITANFDTSTGNCLNTTISSVTDASNFDLTSVSGLTIGDRIEIILSTGAEQREVTNIVSSTVTVGLPLSSTPAGGEVAKQYISAFHIITGGTASANTGATIYSEQFIKFKDSNEPELDFCKTIDIKGN